MSQNTIESQILAQMKSKMTSKTEKIHKNSRKYIYEYISIFDGSQK